MEDHVKQALEIVKALLEGCAGVYVYNVTDSGYCCVDSSKSASFLILPNPDVLRFRAWL